jgi:hypothetical protein
LPSGRGTVRPGRGYDALLAPTFDFDRALRRLRMRHPELLALLGEERTARAAAARMALTQPALSMACAVFAALAI